MRSIARQLIIQERRHTQNRLNLILNPPMLHPYLQ